MECFKCGISGEKALLFDAVSNKGIVKICRKCSYSEDIPIIKKFEDSDRFNEKKQTVYERLSGFRNSRDDIYKEKNILTNKQDEDLRYLVEKNILESAQTSRKMENLVDNFHWIIMRVRRSKKLTQEQFAEKIGESVALIKLAEKGIIPEGKENFVKKLENNLRVKLTSDRATSKSFDEEVEVIKNDLTKLADSGNLGFNDSTTKTLTISDLREMRQKRESKIFEGYTDKKSSVKKEKRELSQSEIDELIFRK